MKKTPTALGILERELVRQIIKLAADGPLAQPVPPQPVKPTTADPVAKPIKPIAQMGKTTGAPAVRSMFDRQGSGDAQARAAIYDKTKQLGSQIHGASSRLGDYVGSMLPVGKPGNSGYGNKPSTYAYGPGGGGAGLPNAAGLVSKAVNAAGVNPAAYGAAPPQGPQQVATRSTPASNTGPSTLQAFGSGLRQGVGNITGGIYNFGRGMANFGVGAVGSAGIGAAQLGARGMDAVGLADNSAQFFDSMAKPFNDATLAGASDMANSFGQYVGVREAPTAVADMRTQQRAELSPAMQTAHDIANGASDMAVGTGAYMIPGAAAARVAAGAGAGAAMLPTAVQPIARGLGAAANTYGKATGLTGKWQAPVAMGTQVVREGIVRPLDQMRGTNYADNAALFPSQLTTPPPEAVAQTQIPEAPPATSPAATEPAGSEFSPEMQQFFTDNNIQTAEDLDALPEEQRAQFEELWGRQPQGQSEQQQAQAQPGAPNAGADPAAWGAAPPQGPTTPAAPAAPPFTPSPEMQQFMTDNNIQTAADFDNLTEEQQLQFNDLYEKQQQPPAAPASKPSTYAYGTGPASASGQTAPQTQPATQQPAQAATPAQPPAQQQNVPDSVKAWGGSLPEQATDEQRAQADQAEQQLKAMPAEKQQKLQAAAGDPNSPEAKETVADGANNYVSQTAADPNNPMPKNDPVAAGNWMSNALNTFHQMPFEAQLLMGAGLSVGVVSMLSSMMGGGGMGSMLLGALGLGAAGMVGAGSGMFGADAQKTVGDAAGGLMTALGMNVPNATDIKARLAAAGKQGPEAAKAELEKVRGEVQPYAAFSQDANKFLTDSSNPNFMYDQAHQYAHDNYAKIFDEKMQNPTTWGERAGNILGLTGEAANTPGTWSHYLSNLTESKEDRINRELAERGWEKQQSVNIMRKAARCWAGYEPVPGKKPYSNNSCRPKSKTKKKTEKKADVAGIAIMRKAARCWSGYEPVPGAKAYSEGSCRPKGSKKTKKEVIQGKKHSPAK